MNKSSKPNVHHIGLVTPDTRRALGPSVASLQASVEPMHGATHHWIRQPTR
jgi:hypothetical protein